MMQQELIDPLAQKLNLELFVAFELIDAYFGANPPEYNVLTMLEAKLSVS
jgi:hypothetical protein